MLVLLLVSYLFNQALTPAPFPPHQHRHGSKKEDHWGRADRSRQSEWLSKGVYRGEDGPRHRNKHVNKVKPDMELWLAAKATHIFLTTRGTSPLAPSGDWLDMASEYDLRCDIFSPVLL